MNCTVCDHPLIDHGYDPESSCDCCSGRSYVSEKVLEVVKESIKPTKKLPKGFVVCEEYPDYIVNRHGAVKHIPTGKFCFLVRIGVTGDPLIQVSKDGKTHVVSAQELRMKAFGVGGVLIEPKPNTPHVYIKNKEKN
jgi:hypothetical protein